MDIFFDRNDISSKRRRQLSENIEKYFEERMEYEKTLNEVHSNENKVFLEEINMNIMSDRQKEVNTILNESAVKYNNSVEELFKSFFTETVIDALNIDSELINENRSNIIDKIHGIYESLKEEFSYDNILMSDVRIKCDKAIKENLNAFKTLDLLEEDIRNISLIIKEKVAKVLDEESEISDIEIKNEEGNYDQVVLSSSTLFKELYMENVKSTVSEIESLNESTVYSNDDIMESSYLETVVDYTILEALNTTRLIEFRDNFYEDSSRASKTRRCGMEL